MKKFNTLFIIYCCLLLPLTTHAMEEHNFIFAHQPSTLQNICIEKLSKNLRNSFLDLHNFPDNLPTKIKTLKKTLQGAPQPLQEQVIDSIDSHLQPDWVYMGYMPEGVSNNFYYDEKRNIVIWSESHGITISDLSKNPQTAHTFFDHQDYRTSQIAMAPQAPLLATSTKKKISIYALNNPYTPNNPISLIKRIPTNANPPDGSPFAFSSHENPFLYIADKDMLRTFEIITTDNNIAVKKLRDNSFPLEAHAIQITPNNKWLICAQESSILIQSLEDQAIQLHHVFDNNNMLFDIACSENSSLFACNIHLLKSTMQLTGIFKTYLFMIHEHQGSQKLTFSIIPGRFVELKKNAIFTINNSFYRNRDNKKELCMYTNTEKLSHTFPALSNYNNESYFHKGNSFYAQKKLTIANSKVLFLKMVLQAAIQQENTRVLIELRKHKPRFLNNQKKIIDLTLENIKEKKSDFKKEYPKLKADGETRHFTGLIPGTSTTLQADFFDKRKTGKNQLLTLPL